MLNQKSESEKTIKKVKMQITSSRYGTKSIRKKSHTLSNPLQLAQIVEKYSKK